MTQSEVVAERLTLDEMPWEEIELPPTDLPDGDGVPMESPWHVDSLTLLKASYIAARGGNRADYFIGTNMFLYYSLRQVRNQDFKGPDLFIVKDVDGKRLRRYWATWEEDGRYPDVILELLSDSTAAYDMGEKKGIYERTFKTAEYFCVAQEVEKLLGWRLARVETGLKYVPIAPDERGWLWSEQMQLWLGAWRGTFLDEEHTWLRFYTLAGDLVLLPEESERQRAEAERQRAEAAEQQVTDLTSRLAELEAELKRLRGEG